MLPGRAAGTRGRWIRPVLVAASTTLSGTHGLTAEAAPLRSEFGASKAVI